MGRRIRAVAALAVALLCGYAALLRIPLPFTPVPITLQTLVLMVGAYTLGRQYAVQMALWYLGLGAVGLPFFSGGKSGWAVLAGPTGGYLVGFALAAAFIGYCRPTRTALRSTLTLFSLAHLIIYSCGAGWLAWLLQLNFKSVLTMGVWPFLAGDLLKCLVAAALVGGWQQQAAKKNKDS
ncbi:MAG: biotin transporter BioY [Deltaproteobacteria bacterium]|nr:biotin transporter BioY [Deltaproteobacteria bacterium]